MRGWQAWHLNPGGLYDPPLPLAQVQYPLPPPLFLSSRHSGLPAVHWATSHLSEGLFWADAVPLLGPRTRMATTKGGEGNLLALSLLQTLALPRDPGRVWQPGLGSKLHVLSRWDGIGWTSPVCSPCTLATSATSFSFSPVVERGPGVCCGVGKAGQEKKGWMELMDENSRQELKLEEE